MKLALFLVLVGGFLCAVALASPIGETLPDNQPEDGAKEILEEAADTSAHAEDEGHVRQARGSIIKSIISGIFNLKWYLAQAAWSKTKSLLWG